MSDEFKDKVMLAVKQVFKTKQSKTLSGIVEKPDFSFFELSDSSLILVEFCMAVEENTGVEVEFEDLGDRPTFLGFVEWITQQKNDA